MAELKNLIVNGAVRANAGVYASGFIKDGSSDSQVLLGGGNAVDATSIACPVSGSGATSGTVTLQPGTVTNCGTLAGDLTLALANGDSAVDGHIPIYCVVFNMGSTLRTISLPSGVSVMNGSVDIDTTDVTYEISIMNNVAVIARTGD